MVERDRDFYLNRKSTRFLTYKGVTLCLSDYAKALGMSKWTLRKRLSMGWTIKRAIETPLGDYRKKQAPEKLKDQRSQMDE